MTLTLGHNLAEQRLPLGKHGGGAVPPPVAELVLTLMHRRARALRHGHQRAGVVPQEAPLLPPQDEADGGVEVVVAEVVGLDVVADQVRRIGYLGDPPAGRERESGCRWRYSFDCV